MHAILHRFARPACASATVLLLIGAAMPCAAAKEEEWTHVMDTPRKKVFVQYGSIRPHGEFIEAWTRYDYLEPQTDVGTKPFRSSKYLGDYDCKGGRERMRRVVSHDGPLEVHDLDLTSHTKWSPVAGPKTVSAIVHKSICAKVP